MWRYGRPRDDGFVDEAVKRKLYRDLYESRNGLTVKLGNQTSVLAQIAAEQAPAREARRLAAMWAILALVGRGELSAADAWSERLIGGEVPSDIASSIKPSTNDSDMFRAIELWKRSI